MKILIVLGSGVETSNTKKLSEAFADGAKEQGHKVEIVFLKGLEVNDCRGCGACQRNGHNCVINDDMTALYLKFNEAEMIVLASPMLFWTISGRLKNFIDRLYSLSKNDVYPHKKAALIMTAGDDDANTFDHAKAYYRRLTEALGWDDMGLCLQGGCMGAEKGARSIPNQGLANAYEFGRSII